MVVVQALVYVFLKDGSMECVGGGGEMGGQHQLWHSALTYTTNSFCCCTLSPSKVEPRGLRLHMGGGWYQLLPYGAESRV